MSGTETTRRSQRNKNKKTESFENIENISDVMNTKTSSRKRPTVKVKTENGDDKHKTEQHTPPKQHRQFTTEEGKQSSPSTLLTRLSITESSPEEIKSKPSKYARARKVLNTTETCTLPGREEELAKVSEFLNDSLLNQKSSSLYISGPPGTGKTSCVRKLLSESFGDKFQSIFINCTGISTIGNIYKRICESLKLKRSTEKENVKAIVEYITKKNKKKMVLLLLDEIDQLVGKKQSVLYTIFEWPGMVNSKLVLVGIANSLDLIDRLLTRLRTRSELNPQHLHFVTYSKQQIIDIFTSRLEEAGSLDVLSPVAIQLLATKVSAVSGDIRQALDIGRRVIELALRKQKGEQVNLNDLGVGYLDEPDLQIKLKDVMDVLTSVYGSTSKKFDDDECTSFPLQQKIIVGALLMILKNDKNKDITIGRSHDVYYKICTKRNIVPLDQSEFAAMCTSIADRGIIKIIKNKEPRLRKIQLQWDEIEVMSALQDKQLIAGILSDTSCLGR